MLDTPEIPVPDHLHPDAAALVRQVNERLARGESVKLACGAHRWSTYLVAPLIRDCGELFVREIGRNDNEFWDRAANADTVLMSLDSRAEAFALGHVSSPYFLAET